ncbi:MAG: hypothetical protein ACR2IE_16005 [Candidatus Sumerlaeaceae bacterium]
MSEASLPEEALHFVRISPDATNILDFRVDWGYAFVYSRRHYHPEYCWDGEIRCDGGQIDSVYQVEYPYTWWGPVHTAKERLLEGLTWRSTTRRGIAGIRIVAQCDNNCEFIVNTEQGQFRFSAEQVRREGRIVFPVGWKYSHCTLIVTLTGYLWFRNAAKPDEIVLEACELKGAEVLNFSRMDQAWIEPGQSVAFDVELPTQSSGGEHAWLFHMQAMTAEDKNDPFALARDYMPIQILANGQTVADLRRLFRWHDAAEQILHDVYEEIPASKLPLGRHTLQVRNGHDSLPLLVHRISVRPATNRPLELAVPNWALVGREFIVTVRVLSSTTLAFDHVAAIRCANPPSMEQEFEHGMHEFRFIAYEPLLNAQISVRDSDSRSISASIEAVYQLAAEQPEVKVGYDMTTVPHDENEFMDWLLEYTWKTQLGNLVCFRPFPMGWGVDNKLMEKWGEYCRDHHVYVEGINMDAGSLPVKAGNYFHGLGTHELSGKLYFCDPANKCTDMKEAMAGYIAAVKAEVQRIREAGCPRVAFGDASGGHRYALMAGADFLRAETMVPHTQQHLSQARAAAQALGCGEWGVHIAVQHPKQPYLESHLGWYYLSLMQAWMMGASFLYEEDSLFVLFKEERQGWDDKLTKGKRDITRAFFRFASTHPRLGAVSAGDSASPSPGSHSSHTSHPTRSAPITWGPQINTALVLGRYAAPFNGFICGTEQDPSYSVWGEFGRHDPAWGHLQPEKCQQVMDVLMPGASTHPLRQRYDRRRFFFSGTPYGDFDQLPIEANETNLSRYRLLLHLGWNTMIHEDYEKLKRWVFAGGTLLVGVPQFSTHVTRDFLLSMDDLALYEGGDVADLCGAKLIGKGVRYCGHWSQTRPDFQGAQSPRLSRVPSIAPDEDGPCHLAEVEMHGAMPVLIDAISGKPMLLKYALGEGTVYLITTWAYAGHEELADFSGAVVAHLAEQHKTQAFVTDPSNEVFWTWWPSTDHPNCGQLMLLNTDWTEPDNCKPVTVHCPAGTFTCSVKEREASIITVLPFGILQPLTSEPHVEVFRATDTEAHLRIHSARQHRFRLQASRTIRAEQNGKLLHLENDIVIIAPGSSTVAEVQLHLPTTG